MAIDFQVAMAFLLVSSIVSPITYGSQLWCRQGLGLTIGMEVFQVQLSYSNCVI